MKKSSPKKSKIFVIFQCFILFNCYSNFDSLGMFWAVFSVLGAPGASGGGGGLWPQNPPFGPEHPLQGGFLKTFTFFFSGCSFRDPPVRGASGDMAPRPGILGFPKEDP